MPDNRNNSTHPGTTPRLRSLRHFAWLLAIGCVPATWFLAYRGSGSHAPDESRVRVEAGSETVSESSSLSGAKSPSHPLASASYPAWPAGKLSGDPAKAYLLDMLTRVSNSFNNLSGYTATFRKRERLKGALLPEQTFFLKIRHEPFAVYLKAVAPAEGKEVIFAKGANDDKVIAHSSGFSRFLVPRLQVHADHPLLMAESRHPVTNAGLGNLIKNLIEFRKKDAVEPDAETTLDRFVDADGREWLRSIHVHSTQRPGRPFARAEVLYHPETRLPLRFTGFDWPESASSPGSPPLGEHYEYDDLSFDAPLSAMDFDPSNPAYQFHRF